MKYIDEFRDGELAKNIVANIRREAATNKHYSFMEFCGGHTHAISRYGIADLLPANVRMIHGPGCPVCVLPIGRVDQAIRLALEMNVIVCTYADTMRVPASDNLSLMRAKSRGGDVRMIYSPQDALKIARDNPQREVVFFAIGFETTTPPTALIIKQAKAEGIANFSVLCNHVLTPAAITHILQSPEVRQYGTVPLDGFIGPAHVSVVIGSQPYEHFSNEYRKPVVIAGFEPLDVLQAILMLMQRCAVCWTRWRIIQTLCAVIGSRSRCMNSTEIAWGASAPRSSRLSVPLIGSVTIPSPYCARSMPPTDSPV